MAHERAAAVRPGPQQPSGEPQGQPSGQPSPYGQPHGQPYGQQPPPYGQPQPNAYGQPAYGYQQAPDHPRSTTILVLGILGLVACQILGPVAWVMGNGAIREIDASQGRLGGRGAVQAGRICGIVATVILILASWRSSP